MDDMNKKLAEYVINIKLRYSISISEGVFDFPSKKKIEINNKAVLRVLVEQAEKLLNNRVDYCIFNKGIGAKDRQGLLELFIADVEQFATEHNLIISENCIARFSQSKISDHTFFHLASCPILPKTYDSIDLHQHEKNFNIYSIPFKLRVAIENKIKSIIGFQSCDITRNGRVKTGTAEFPFTMVIQELIRLNCLDLPCNLQSISNIYTWSCSFCHTGEKEYLWMSMKALEILSTLFLFESQKKYEIFVEKLWPRCIFSEEYLNEKLIKYNGFLSPLYYLKSGWSISKLQDSLNNTNNRKLSYYKFKISNVALDGKKSFYCSSSGISI
ncbi:hypothetical protein [Dickeya dianthicola]|uniref:hypothetical protein n=1 Tax=Dickeya dianthicola TaxID=204039 RepID=UPI0018683E5E|nr:hypothetical protein [Dickeya dianthicola]QOL14019.1 hypothetical protein HGI48_07160 [Dickeya dianthicola]